MQRLKAMPDLSMISGMNAATNRQKAIDAGADDFMQKPAPNDQLLAKIEQLIGL